MPGDALELSRRELYARAAALIMGALVPDAPVPRLGSEHLNDLERRFWDALLRDVLPVRTHAFGSGTRDSERV